MSSIIMEKTRYLLGQYLPLPYTKVEGRSGGYRRVYGGALDTDNMVEMKEISRTGPSDFKFSELGNPVNLGLELNQLDEEPAKEAADFDENLHDDGTFNIVELQEEVQMKEQLWEREQLQEKQQLVEQVAALQGAVEQLQEKLRQVKEQNKELQHENSVISDLVLKLIRTSENFNPLSEFGGLLPTNY